MPRLGTLIGYLPVALGHWLSLAVFGHRRSGARLVSLGVWLLIVLAVVPTLAYAVELIVRPTTIRDLVERRTDSTTTFVEFDGYAMPLRLAAEPPPQAGDRFGAYRWIAVRDGLDSRQLALVRTPIDVATLAQRWVVGRITADPSIRDATVDALAERGVGAGSDPMLLDEVTDPNAEFAQVDDPSSLRELAAGTVVRVLLRFSGAAVAHCALADACQARQLGAGTGRWLHLASGPSDHALPVLVRTDYPPSAAPFSGAGRQARDQATVTGFLALPWVDQLIGWGAFLTVAHVEHDLGLPVVRDWTGPALFLLTAGLVWLGRRLGYPRFVVSDASLRQWGTPPAWADGQVLSATASARLMAEGLGTARPLIVEDQPARVGHAPDGSGLEVELLLPDGTRRVAVPRVVGGLGTVEIGTLHALRGVAAALRIGWYGSQLRLDFASPADRDRAAAAVRVGPSGP